MEENAVVQIEEEINETDETIEVEENVVESLKREHRTNIKGNNERCCYFNDLYVWI